MICMFSVCDCGVLHCAGGEKGEFAKRLNLIRRELLAEVRGGDLPEQCQSSALSADSSGYEGRIKHLFHSRLHQV